MTVMILGKSWKMLAFYDILLFKRRIKFSFYSADNISMTKKYCAHMKDKEGRDYYHEDKSRD